MMPRQGGTSARDHAGLSSASTSSAAGAPSLSTMSPAGLEPRIELEEVAEKASVPCFGGPLFGGCSLCALNEDELVMARPVQRLPRWDRSFCDGRRRGCGDGKTEEYVEEVDETTSLGDDDRTTYSDDGGEVGDVPRFNDTRRKTADDSQDVVHRELETVMWSAGDTFAKRGWVLERIGGGRYRMSGRTIKLSLLPPGAPLPLFMHLQKAVDYDIAERAARITVSDGPLRQPLMDYLLHTGQNESYDQRGTENIAGVSGAAKFLDWNTTGTDDRLLEMLNATMQANVRRNAAGDVERVSALQSEGSRFLAMNQAAVAAAATPMAGFCGGLPQVNGLHVA